MNYANKSIYNQHNQLQTANLATKQQWFAYLMIMGIVISPSSALGNIADIRPTSMSYIRTQSEYSSALYDYERTMKQLEIEKIEKAIENFLDIKIVGYWLPNISVEKECIFFKCDLDEETKKDYKKISDIELNMYLSVKDIIDQSKYFDMVAMI